MKSPHAKEIAELFEVLEVDSAGLSEEESRKRLAREGVNEIEAEEQRQILALILKELRSPLIYLLAGVALIALLAGKPLDAAVIGFVVILNTILGVVQEYRAEKSLRALKSMAAPTAMVVRDGDKREVEARRVVPGDILELKAGQTVPADARVLDATNLEVDESALTGESEPVAKKPGDIPADTPLAERSNMVFSSSPVLGGSGKALVVNTGIDTEVGKIAAEMRETERGETPLQRRLRRLSIYIGLLAVSLAALVFIIGLAMGREIHSMLMYSVAVAVSSIPEGLPAVISVTLAVGVLRMSKRKAILRRLPAMETLGSTTVVCADKTGTLTRNEMTVVTMWVGGQTYEVSGRGYEPTGHVEGYEDEPAPELQRLLEIGVLANEADLERLEDGWRLKGMPTEGALLVAGMKSGIEVEDFRSRHARLDSIPFSSDHKYMATLNEFPERGRLLLLKGAPEQILRFCAHEHEGGSVTKLDEQARRRIEEAHKELANQGRRVVAAAWREIPADVDSIGPEQAEKDLVFAGMWGIEDPPRETVIQSIENARRAGIRVIMLTGDHASTASAVAREVGIMEGRTYTGDDLESMSDPEFEEAVAEASVFARVSPSHKLRILEALQESGYVVAMTGDGVNDAPALKSADIGVAMGKEGTDVAREAADMVLTDDNFSTIMAAVEEGRVIFSNIRRVVFYLLTTNAGEVLTFIAALLLGLPLPLTAVMVLWVNLVTDGVCDITLGVEPKHETVLDDPPRRSDQGIIDGVMVWRILLLAPVMALGTLFVFERSLDQGIDTAQSMAFITLAAFQWFHALNARSRSKSAFSIGFFSNRWLLLAIFVAIVLQIGSIHLPFARGILGTTELTAGQWAMAVAVASSIFVVEEGLKLFGIPRR
ncbi:MAG: cation-translocating P-type ATPase [Oceanidesulfovibrio sp.]